MSETTQEIDINDWEAHNRAAWERVFGGYVEYAEDALEDAAPEPEPEVELETNQNIVVVILCAWFSRVVGYYSAIQGWNKGKRQEEAEREYYKL